MDKNEIEKKARAALAPIDPATDHTTAPDDLLFTAKRTAAGDNLPPYYLVYFLLIDLLKFRDLGRFEKIAWSVPIDFNGRAYLIEHRKFGLGIFSDDEEGAEEVAARIRNAVKVAEPYFDWLADQAADGSDLNVVNRSAELFERHRFFYEHYQAKRNEALTRKDEVIKTPTGENGMLYTWPSREISRHATWYALSTIESFFSWTEHIFIHLAILQGRLKTGRDVKEAANSNWLAKFQNVFASSDQKAVEFSNQLQAIRKQIRNFDAHGSFGKQREAFSFHSSVGAVPLRLPHHQDRDSMSFGRGVDFVDHEAIELIDRFIDFLWSGPRSPAKIYIQESYMPLILSYAVNGTYKKAMASNEEMEAFCHALGEEHDRYANMDF